MRVRIGELLKHFRIEKRMSAKKISTGLCSTSVLSDYEKGKKIPDSLSFCFFMERMGVLPEEFAIMAMNEEYGYWIWKEQVIQAIEVQSWDAVHTLMEAEVARAWECNEKLKEQFFLYAKAVCEANEKGDYAQAAEDIERAVRFTVEVENLASGEAVYGTTELILLILYLNYGMRGNRLDVEAGKTLFYKLEKYVREKKGNAGDATKCYPKLICVGMHVLSDVLCEEEKRKLCETAINMLREYKDMYDILELLKLYIPLLSEKEEIAYYKKNLEVLESLWMRAEMDTGFRPEKLYFQMPKIYLIDEFMYSKRKEKNLTQEVISEGICEPETYSRVETGKRKPQKMKYFALMERLEIGWAYFRGDLYTNDVNMYDLKCRHRIATLEQRYADSLDILNEMEKGLDMTHPINIQYIKINQINLKYRMKELSTEETYRSLSELLELTKKVNFEFKEVVYYSQTEMEIVTYIAQLLREMGRSQDGIQLIENMLEQANRSKVSATKQGKGAWFAMDVLSCLYFSIAEYEKATEIVTIVFQLCMRLRDAANIPAILDALADDLEHMGTQYSNEYQLLYRQSYYVAEFYHNVSVANLMKNYYEENFGRMD